MSPGAVGTAEPDADARGVAPAGVIVAPNGTVSTYFNRRAGAPTVTSGVAIPCDPGLGFPQPATTCPVEEPTIALLTSYAADGALTAQPLRVLTNGPEGKAWAKEHGVEYPFPNDYYQVPDGAPKTVRLTDTTVCTGVILVGYEEQLADHVVDCGAFRTPLRRLGEITVALWADAGGLVQLSELYRP